MIEQPELFSADDRKRASWLAFDASTTPETAAAVFIERYGRRPAVVKRSGPVVLAGPIPDKGVRT